MVRKIKCVSNHLYNNLNTSSCVTMIILLNTVLKKRSKNGKETGYWTFYIIILNLRAIYVYTLSF